MIDSPEHALITGMVFGAMLQAGLDVRPEVIDGDYTDVVILELPDPALGVTVRLHVERPEAQALDSENKSGDTGTGGIVPPHVTDRIPGHEGDQP